MNLDGLNSQLQQFEFTMDTDIPLKVCITEKAKASWCSQSLEEPSCLDASDIAF